MGLGAAEARRLATLLALALAAAGCDSLEDPLGELIASPSSLELGYPEHRELRLEARPQLRPPHGECPPTAFVHLIDGEGQLRRTFDHRPPCWEPGRPFAYSLKIHQSALAEPLPAGRYTLWLGLYDPPSGRSWRFSGEDGEARRSRIADVQVPATGPRAVGFGFEGGWLAPQPGGSLQVPVERWWSKEATLSVLPKAPGILWLQLVVPAAEAVREGLAGTPLPRGLQVEVGGSCSDRPRRLESGRSTIELALSVPCELTFRAEHVIGQPLFQTPRSAALEVLSWTAAPR